MEKWRSLTSVFNLLEFNPSIKKLFIASTKRTLHFHGWKSLRDYYDAGEWTMKRTKTIFRCHTSIYWVRLQNHCAAWFIHYYFNRQYLFDQEFKVFFFACISTFWKTYWDWTMYLHTASSISLSNYLFLVVFNLILYSLNATTWIKLREVRSQWIPDIMCASCQPPYSFSCANTSTKCYRFVS